jgi:TetR/AcrR family transcriptional regulator, transcriptional repressor for nem operon
MGRTSNAKERLMEAVIELIWLDSYAGTTIDDICNRAGVKKGSFYYFFDSKMTLAIAALEGMHEEWIAKLNAAFSPLHTGLERLKIKTEIGLQEQEELFAKYGRVAGCPLFTIGSECVHVEPELTRRIQKWIEEYMVFIESAIRDAHAAGEVDAPDAKATGATLLSYWQGVITQARIQNDLNLLRNAWQGAAHILRVKEKQPTAA